VAEVIVIGNLATTSLLGGKATYRKDLLARVTPRAIKAVEAEIAVTLKALREGVASRAELEVALSSTLLVENACSLRVELVVAQAGAARAVEALVNSAVADGWVLLDALADGLDGLDYPAGIALVACPRERATCWRIVPYGSDTCRTHATRRPC
jgi:hypothetical protein